MQLQTCVCAHAHAKVGFTKNWHTHFKFGGSKHRFHLPCERDCRYAGLGVWLQRGALGFYHINEVGKGENIGQSAKASISLGIMFIASMEWERSSLYVRL